MRRAVDQVGVPDHPGLALTAWAPVGADGKVAQAQAWLERVADQPVDPSYAHAFARWRDTFRGQGTEVFEKVVKTRLLVGHGLPAATDVGIALHRTWGVPVIPGSALKGLAAHYLEAVYGPEDPSVRPWEEDREAERRAFQGVMWDGKRIRRGPGAAYREIFGAPDAEEDREFRAHGHPAGAQAGGVRFHDALYVPGSAEENSPLRLDVITVHQKTYYGSLGKKWPSDYDNPNPVSFLSVRPGTRFLFALSGPNEALAVARRLLEEALSAWGIGGKTSSGYGRLEEPVGDTGVGVPSAGVQAPARHPTPRYRRGDRVRVTRVEGSTGKGAPRFVADDGLPGYFAAEEAPQLALGESMEVWVANVGAGTYTLMRRPPTSPAAGPRQGMRRKP